MITEQNQNIINIINSYIFSLYEDVSEYLFII